LHHFPEALHSVLLVEVANAAYVSQIGPPP
jgi:hypothetical protein